jgi:hypothetical protein
MGDVLPHYQLATQVKTWLSRVNTWPYHVTDQLMTDIHTRFFELPTLTQATVQKFVTLAKVAQPFSPAVVDADPETSKRMTGLYFSWAIMPWEVIWAISQDTQRILLQNPVIQLRLAWAAKYDPVAQTLIQEALNLLKSQAWAFRYYVRVATAESSSDTDSSPEDNPPIRLINPRATIRYKLDLPMFRRRFRRLKRFQVTPGKALSADGSVPKDQTRMQVYLYKNNQHSGFGNWPFFPGKAADPASNLVIQNLIQEVSQGKILPATLQLRWQEILEKHNSQLEAGSLNPYFWWAFEMIFWSEEYQQHLLSVMQTGVSAPIYNAWKQATDRLPEIQAQITAKYPWAWRLIRPLVHLSRAATLADLVKAALEYHCYWSAKILSHHPRTPPEVRLRVQEQLIRGGFVCQTRDPKIQRIPIQDFIPWYDWDPRGPTEVEAEAREYAIDPQYLRFHLAPFNRHLQRLEQVLGLTHEASYNPCQVRVPTRLLLTPGARGPPWPLSHETSKPDPDCTEADAKPDITDNAATRPSGPDEKTRAGALWDDESDDHSWSAVGGKGQKGGQKGPSKGRHNKAPT